MSRNIKQKQTAWKKNRRFGDKMGGRMRLKLHDNIFKREHSFTAPTDLDETPIFIVENTSRDYYFPIGVDDVHEILSNYPVDRTECITHVWLRKHIPHNPKYDTLASYICGSGVYLICLYPIKKTGRIIWGKRNQLGLCFMSMKNIQKSLRRETGFMHSLLMKAQRNTTRKSYYLTVSMV